ncbi:hypothetical protein AAMO2058_000589700 [Amorphochlora amoebiformis]
MEKVFESEKLGLSTEEKKRLYNCMRKKEFHSLLHDYMRDISDPKTKNEQDVYISQLENNKQLPPGIKILRPKSQMCVETKCKEGGDVVYINLCSSPHVREAEPKVVQRNGVMGTSWSIPYSIGPNPRTCRDDAKNIAKVYDVVFNKQSMEKFKPDSRLMDLMSKTAIEGIQGVMKTKLDAIQFKILKNTCKGGNPPSLSLRDPKAESVGPVDPLLPKFKPTSRPSLGSNTTEKPKEQKKYAFLIGESVKISNLKTKTEYNGKIAKIHDNLIRKGRVKVIVRVEAKDVILNIKPENLKLHSLARSFSKASVDEEKEKHKATKNGSEVPTYTVVHRGSQGDGFMQFGAEKTEIPGSRRPRELVVNISVPKIGTLKGVVLDISDEGLSLDAPPYKLSINLPYKINPDKGSAKLRRKKGVLVVTLPVVPLSREEIEIIRTIRNEEKEKEKSSLKTHDKTPVLPQVPTPLEHIQGPTPSPQPTDYPPIDTSTPPGFPDTPLISRVESDGKKEAVGNQKRAVSEILIPGRDGIVRGGDVGIGKGLERLMPEEKKAPNLVEIIQTKPQKYEKKGPCVKDEKGSFGDEKVPIDDEMPSREEKEAPMEEKKGNLSGGMQTYFEVGCVPDMLSLVPQPYRSQGNLSKDTTHTSNDDVERLESLMFGLD